MELVIWNLEFEIKHKKNNIMVLKFKKKAKPLLAIFTFHCYHNTKFRYLDLGAIYVL